MSKRHSEEYYRTGSARDLTHNTFEESKRQKVSNEPTQAIDNGTQSKIETSTLNKGDGSKLKPRATSSKFTSGIKINLANAKKKIELKPKISVASVFNQESDEEPEEMPPEARMRMRNMGRDTPTSSGPNSFGKTKQGFCHAKRVFEKSLEKALEEVDN